MISLLLGNPLPLRLQMDDGETDKFVKAYVFNGLGTLVTSVILNHLVGGLYINYYTPSSADAYHAVYILFTDNTYTTQLGPFYRNSSDSYLVQSLTAIGESIWNTDISDNSIANSAAQILKDTHGTVGGIDPAALAAAVWNDTTVSYSLPNSFGLLLNVVKQTILNIENELNSNTEGLQAIVDHVTNQTQLVIGEVNQNETKINQIIPAISSSQSALSSEHGAMTLLLQGLASTAVQDKTDVISEILTNRTKIDEVKTYVLSISNNTTVRFVVPEQLIRPETGTTTYQFYLRLFDDTGHPQAPDSAPTIVVKDIITTAQSSGTMIQDGVKVGAYSYSYTVASGTPVNPLFIEATVIENGVTRYIPATSQVTEFAADLNAIQTQLISVDGKVTDSQNKINNNIFGLQALHDQLTTIDADIISVKTGVTAIKSTTDALPHNIATTTDIAGIMTAIAALPTLSQISNLLTVVKESILGVDGKTNSDVYAKIDFTGIMKSNDSRLAFLDANISSRSTLSVSEVWNYATRTLTAISIPTVEARKIWEVLTTDIAAFGSFGALFKSTLDASVSSRSTQSQVANALNGVAQESSLGSVLATIVGEVNQNEVKINTLLSLLNIIGPDVTSIKNTKSLEATVTAQTSAISNTLVSLNLLIQAIKMKTDNIPVDPARESTVSLRPTNPLLNNDSRMLNLDSKISTRSTLQVTDLATLATNVQVVAGTGTVISALNTVLTAINNVFNSIDPIPTGVEIDAKLGSLSSLTALEQAKNEIISAISHISGGGSGASASEIWSYPDRGLTEAVEIDSGELDNLATRDDTNNYKFNIHTSLVDGHQTVFISTENKGNIFAIDGVIVTMKKSDGTTLWSASSDVNDDGIHVVVSPVNLITNSLYYIQVTAEIDGDAVTSVLPFTTVG